MGAAVLIGLEIISEISDKEGRFVLIKAKIDQEDVTLCIFFLERCLI